jgi:hypothetical protein
MPNNKLSNLLSVIDSIALLETIAIVTKNINQSAELAEFLKEKGKLCLVVDDKNSLDNYNKDSNYILIINYEHLALLKEVAISYVISIFASISLPELKEKANLCALKEKFILIELISKFDFQFIQTLYKFSEISIERFSLLENNIMLENKNGRALLFLKKTVSNNSLLKSEELSNDIVNFINSCNLDEIKSYFKLFFSFTLNCKLPTLEFNQPYTNNREGSKEFKIVLKQGYLDTVVEDSLKDFFLKIPGINVENISQLTIDEKQTTVILKSKELTKNDINSFLINNPYLGSILEVELIHEKLIEEMGKFGEGSSDSYQRRDRDGGSRGGYQRRDNDGGSRGGYQRRDRDGGGSSGGYQRRDRDGGGSSSGGYQRRDRDGGGSSGGYQRRDSYSSRPSSGGYENKYKSNNSSYESNSSSGSFESKDRDNKDSKPGYYGKSNYSGGSGGSSSYGDKKPSYRSFSSDFGSGDMQNSGKDRSGYDNKRKDFRGGDRRGGSSFGGGGGGYKKPYERSGSSYNNYSKDRYSKGGSSFGGGSNEEDGDSE